MRISDRAAPSRRIALLAAIAVSALIFCRCGGGGGGDGPGVGQQNPYGDGIILTSITFPACTDLTGATSDPPFDAPLSQQVVFTFSDIPDGPALVDIDRPPGYSTLQIYADLEPEYAGPNVVVDTDRNVIPARGTYETFGNTIVFTPFFPEDPIDLGPNAALDAVPGLLPDTEYSVFVPIGGGGAIRNLKGIKSTVTNPIRFVTVTESLPNLFFRNHPAEPPRVVDFVPADGSVDVAINTRTPGLPGFPPVEEFSVRFDQPLFPSRGNIEGEDIDGDGIDEEKIFLLYSPPTFFAALDEGTSRDPGLYRVDRKTGMETLVGPTREYLPPHFPPTGLNSLVLEGSGRLLGATGSTVYRVEYRQLLQGSVPLHELADFDGRTAMRGLAQAPDGTFYAVDSLTGELFSVALPAGALTPVATFGPGAGVWYDLAVGADGTIYAVAVLDSGTTAALTTLVSVDPYTQPATVVTLYTGQRDTTSISMSGFRRISMYERQGPSVDVYDPDTASFVAGGHYAITGGLEKGALFALHNPVAELGTRIDLVENGHRGSKAVFEPAGVLPFGARLQLVVRRGLENIRFATLAGSEGRGPADADLLATIETFDHTAVVDDTFHEAFVDTEWKGDNAAESPALPSANWAVHDVDGEPPEYEHLLATYGMSGDGGLGDFRPLGVFPTVMLDTDYQSFPLFDGSTPGVRKQTVVKGGVFHFHDIVIPAGVTILAEGSNPLVMTATGRIEIQGTIDVRGKDGMSDVTYNSAFTPVPGGMGGPGAGRGGVSQPAKPEDFRLLTDLRSPEAGERGWGPRNLARIGGFGGACCADSTDVKYKGGGAGSDKNSRGSGGGGGSYFQIGGMGYHGLGQWGADPFSKDVYYIRDEYEFDDGAPPDMPGYNLVPHKYRTRHGPGGDPGDAVFDDSNGLNDFIGADGELKAVQGGQGGGGGGSRLDSLNPATIALGASRTIPVDRSAYDAKGGGGGGGGGAVALYALDGIEIHATGSILATGGMGGGGEVTGLSNYGGGAGGGSGGAVILDSAGTIRIEPGALVDVSGGWFGDAKEKTTYGTTDILGNACLNPQKGGGFKNNHKLGFCAFSNGDGGFGGHGIIQLQVSEPEKNLDIADWSVVSARLCVLNWYDAQDGLCDFNLGQVHCGCTSAKNCDSVYYHFLVNYPAPEQPELPLAHPDPLKNEWAPCVDPRKTPSSLGPVSYGLSKWIDMGQTIHRGSIGGIPAPSFTGFRGIDTNTGRAITINGFIPDPGSNDFEVYAPDWNQGMVHYIPEENDVVILFQGADAAAPGSKVPAPDTMTDWTADIATLSGMQFIRFRVRLDTARDKPLSPTSPKPQINFVRIRMQY